MTDNTLKNAKLAGLVPSPKKITEFEGALEIVSSSPAFICDEGKELSAKLISYVFSNIFDMSDTAKGAAIIVERDDENGVTGAYTIDINENVHIVANGFEGVASAIQTLKLIAESTECGISFPKCRIEDAPYKAMRGVHLFTPPPYMVEEFFTLLDVLASLKYNVIILETGGSIELDRHPEVNNAWMKFCREAREFPGGPQGVQRSEPYWKDSTHVELAHSTLLKKKDLKRIADHAEMLGIEIVPEIQALSHAYYLTLAHPHIAERPYERWPDSYCPMCEDSYTLYFEVVEEILEVLNPKRVHIGHDEIRVLGECPRCRGKSGHELLAYDLNKLHAFYKERGIKIMMWGEMLQNFTSWKGVPTGGVEKELVRDRYGRPYALPATYLAADMVPKDILVFDWYYSMSNTTEKEFNEKGFTEIFGNFRGSMVANWDKRSASPNVIGAEVSTWCVPNEYEISFNGWFYELVFSSMVLWQEGYNDSLRSAFDERSENYLPTIQKMMSGERRFDGSLATLKDLKVAEGEAKDITYRFGTIDEDTVKAVVAGGLTPISTEDKFEFDSEVDSFVFFHATTSAYPRRLTTWNFLDKTDRIPARYAIDYDDGMCVTCQVEFGSAGHYGVAIGNMDSKRGFVRPTADEEMLSDIDDANIVNDEKVTLSPMYAPIDQWRAAHVYSCRFAELDTPDGIRTIYASEWKNPYPGHKVKAVRFFSEPASKLTAQLYAAAIAK